jgi:hypothetical protein
MGIPILQAMFGPRSIDSVLVLDIIASLLMIPLTTMLLTVATGKGSGIQAFCRACRVPCCAHLCGRRLRVLERRGVFGLLRLPWIGRFNWHPNRYRPVMESSAFALHLPKRASQ